MGQIVLKSITTDLNPESLERAIKEIDDFKNKLYDAMVALIEWLAEEGAKTAKAQLLSFNPPAFYTRQLYETIQCETDAKDRSGRVYVESVTEYAFFVEYGTGIYVSDKAGNGKPLTHYSSKNNKTYNYNSKRHKPSDGWVYFNDRDGKWHITSGMPPRPFMHNTLVILTDKAQTEGGRVIAEYLSQGG